MRSEFVSAIENHQATFDVELSGKTVETLAEYYELILEHNPLLHLVAPCSPAEFATRHILESLTMLKHLPEGSRFADIGSGGGLPAIPCLIARDDLSAVLVESKEKKVNFLKEVTVKLGLEKRVEIVNKQFAETALADVLAVSCRALDKFTERLPRLLKWAGRRKLLIFAGENLRTELKLNRVEFDAELMPLSEQRFLFSSRL
jgi:16S rRNA (guanine527-N7)-methyltransferase